MLLRDAGWKWEKIAVALGYSSQSAKRVREMVKRARKDYAMSTETYSLVLWFQGGFYEVERRGLTTREAITAAVPYTLPTRPVNMMPGFELDRVQLVCEQDDSTAFLWDRAKGWGQDGVVYPTEEARA